MFIIIFIVFGFSALILSWIYTKLSFRLPFRYPWANFYEQNAASLLSIFLLGMFTTPFILLAIIHDLLVLWKPFKRKPKQHE